MQLIPLNLDDPKNIPAILELGFDTLVRSDSVELLPQIEVLFQLGHFEVTIQASNCHIANKLLVDC